MVENEAGSLAKTGRRAPHCREMKSEMLNFGEPSLCEVPAEVLDLIGNDIGPNGNIHRSAAHRVHLEAARRPL